MTIYACESMTMYVCEHLIRLVSEQSIRYVREHRGWRFTEQIIMCIIGKLISSVCSPGEQIVSCVYEQVTSYASGQIVLCFSE